LRRKGNIVAARNGSTSNDDWEVVIATAYNRGNPADGMEESVLINGPEAEARRVYASTVSVAADAGYEYVRLRSSGQVVEWWPPPTGWTS
jgi:hypothetical protein